MKSKFAPLLTELIWLTVSSLLTLVLASFFLDWSFVSGEQDLHFHDTYIVISRWLILIPFFCLVTFIIYFFKEKRKSFSRTIQNWITIVTGLILIIALTYLIKIFSQSINGWTLYPPLSGLGNSKQPQLIRNPISEFESNFLTVIQFIIFPMLLYVTYHSGKLKRNVEKS